WAEVGPKCPAADVSTDTHDPTLSQLKPYAPNATSGAPMKNGLWTAAVQMDMKGIGALFI
ncbi:hypothetical protein Alg215_09091, partial [Pyrenophora tritici-repentis]